MKLYQVVKREENPTITIKEAEKAMREGKGVIFVVNKDNDKMLGVIVFDEEEGRFGYTESVLTAYTDGLYYTADSLDDCMEYTKDDLSMPISFQFTSKCVQVLIWMVQWMTFGTPTSRGLVIQKETPR